ncbi:MAG: hypothetical protein ACOC56_00175 [Atribacterota bacterium]
MRKNLLTLDLECSFDKETFIKIKGEQPECFDENKFINNKYDLYPCDIIDFILGNHDGTEEYEFEINITKKSDYAESS